MQGIRYVPSARFETLGPTVNRLVGSRELGRTISAEARSAQDLLRFHPCQQKLPREGELEFIGILFAQDLFQL